jgi:hypothetical protein
LSGKRKKRIEILDRFFVPVGLLRMRNNSSIHHHFIGDSSSNSSRYESPRKQQPKTMAKMCFPPAHSAAFLAIDDSIWHWRARHTNTQTEKN